MIEVLMFSMPFAVAIFAGFLAPFGIYVIYRVGANIKPTTKLNLLFWAVAVGAIIPIILTKRTLNLELENTKQLTLEDFSSGMWSSRILTLSVIGLVVAEVIRGWLMTRKKLLPKPAYSLLVAMLGFEFGMILLGITGATHPSFTYKSLYIPLTLLAVYYLANNIVDIKQFALNVKLAMLVLVLGSLIAAVVAPNFALLRPYDGILPSINFRLYGISGHANTLGPMALLLITIELYFPSRFLLRLVIFAAANLVFLLAQSKTVWIAALVLMLIVFIPQFLIYLRSKKYGFEMAIVTILLMLMGFIFLGIAATYLDLLHRVEDTKDITTFTGRTLIWAKTISEFEQNPFFGYGPEIWGMEYRLKEGLLAAGQAHNQFIQTIGEGGGIGFILIVTYVAVLFTYAVKLFKQSRGLVLAIFIIIFVRCFTESPLRSGPLLDWAAFTHLLLIIFTVYYSNVRYRELSSAGPE